MPLTSRDRHDRFREAAFLPGFRGALLRFDRIGVDVVAGEAVFRGDEIGRDALRHEVGFDRDMRIDRPGAAGGADADALIDSTPPPIAMSCWPAITCAAAMFTASSPEAQKRLICTPGTWSP